MLYTADSHHLSYPAQESEHSSGGEPTSPAADKSMSKSKESKPAGIYQTPSFKLSKSDTAATAAYDSKPQKSLLFEDISDEEVSSAPAAKLDWAAG